MVGNSKNVTIEHNNYRIVYSPVGHCESHHDGVLGGCSSWFNPWTWREAGPFGSVLTYRSTISQYRVKEDPHITLSFSGSVVYLYGAPVAYAARPFAPQHVCIDNACRVIDVEQAYLHPPRGDMESASLSGSPGQGSTVQDITTSMSIPHPELEPVLIWSTTGLNDKIEHTLRLALASLPAADNAEMSIVKIVYTHATYGWGEYPPKPPAPGPDHAFAGPLQPPYAKWVPLAREPLPPTAIDRPPSGQSFLLPIFGSTLLVVCCVLALFLCSCHSKTWETEPLLSVYSPPRSQPLHRPVHSEPGSRPSDQYGSRSVGPNNSRGGPPSVVWVTTGSPPRRPNAADTPPAYSSIIPSGSNGLR
ncbi:transmembrane protein, putative [Rhizoctonia solani AG-3 Rhs1AP]|uniref:Transmembrane protein, putative n=2 Tax=Rhizoctonia solani AG-3 TaxID=1086053 RepID=A0A0A1ULM4_9AGAM|nr:transmembrane protein, putative [Rhizoctonia solani AG-3 Rhs1AP]KEP52860.1 putative transmembrane protein [Rhizoctonia solani 123E]